MMMVMGPATGLMAKMMIVVGLVSDSNNKVQVATMLQPRNKLNTY